MLLLGIDVGTSSVKVSVVDADSQKVVASAQYPDTESPITVLQSGWAEQSPEMWWEQVINAVKRCHATNTYTSKNIKAIGIAYQMHGLVVVDKNQKVLRDSIIWCDSRAVQLGEAAFNSIGEKQCLTHLLNSPGNFTAAKLAWVKNNEPAVFERIYKVMLPGDFFAMKLTGDITTSISALSEGIFYDFKNQKLSADVMHYFGFEESLIPEVKPLFSSHGTVSAEVAQLLEIPVGIPVSYKAGDQPNNALSLNVLKPGEVAATAGTSGVIYSVSDQLSYYQLSRVNTFAHVNYTKENPYLGTLLCINGTGSIYRWAKNLFGNGISYAEMNELAKQAPEGSEGLRILPFGNGVERMLSNQHVGAQIHQIDLNKHDKPQIFRAVQEGIACAFRYGLDIMRANGTEPKVIKAGKANLFLSDLFAQSFVNATGVPVQLYNNDGSVGAALGAGIGAGIFKIPDEAFSGMEKLKEIHPQQHSNMEEIYLDWSELLTKQLNSRVSE